MMAVAEHVVYAMEVGSAIPQAHAPVPRIGQRLAATSASTSRQIPVIVVGVISPATMEKPVRTAPASRPVTSSSRVGAVKVAETGSSTSHRVSPLIATGTYTSLIEQTIASKSSTALEPFWPSGAPSGAVTDSLITPRALHLMRQGMSTLRMLATTSASRSSVRTGPS